jgi:O-antigen ligase
MTASPVQEAVPLPQSRSRNLYEWICVLLLLSGATLGPILFGAVRLWSFGGLSFIVLLGCLLTFGLALRSEKGRWLVAPPGALLFTIFSIYVLARIPFSTVSYEARIEFLKIASLCTAYWAWMILLDKPGRWRILTSILILTGACISLYALIQQTQDTIRILNYVEIEGRRAGGTYVCPNHFAAYVEIILCLSLAMIFMKKSGWALKLFSVYALVTILPALYFTQSRSGWIGAFVGIAVFFLLWSWRKSLKLFLSTILILPVAVIAISFAIWSSSEIVRDRIDEMIRPAPQDAEIPFEIYNMRLDVWRDTIDMIGDAPVFGHGGGSYRYIMPHYLRMVFARFLRYAHNDYLHHTAEYGIVGLLLFGLIIIAGAIRYLIWIKRTERDKNACLAIGLLAAFAANLAHCFFDYNMQYYSNNHVLILFAAITASAFFTAGDFKPRALKRPLLLWIPALLIVLAMLIAWIPTLGSYALEFKAEAQREDLDLPEAAQTFKLALKIDPGNWNAHVGLGQIYKTRAVWELEPEMKAQLLEDSLRHYEQAHAANPYDVAAKYGISQIMWNQGDIDAALERQRQITEYYPGYIFYKIRYGLNLRKAERYEEALEAFNKARRLQPDESEKRTIDLNRKFLQKKIREMKK